MALTEEMIATDLGRRQGGYGRGRRQQIERDHAEITSGVRHGRTIGSPIALWLENKDHSNANWQVRMAVEQVEEDVERVTLLRPGHADLAGTQKYGLDDVRQILERSSAREDRGARRRRRDRASAARRARRQRALAHPRDRRRRGRAARA